MAKELEKRRIPYYTKDMAGLLKPKAAYELIGELREATHLPIHLHTLRY